MSSRLSRCSSSILIIVSLYLNSLFTVMDKNIVYKILMESIHCIRSLSGVHQDAWGSVTYRCTPPFPCFLKNTNSHPIPCNDAPQQQQWYVAPPPPANLHPTPQVTTHHDNNNGMYPPPAPFFYIFY